MKFSYYIFLQIERTFSVMCVALAHHLLVQLGHNQQFLVACSFCNVCDWLLPPGKLARLGRTIRNGLFSSGWQSSRKTCCTQLNLNARVRLRTYKSKYKPVLSTLALFYAHLNPRDKVNPLNCACVSYCSRKPLQVAAFTVVFMHRRHSVICYTAVFYACD